MNHLMIDDRCRAMPWDEVDAVVFDVGNVLLAFSPEGMLRELFPQDEALRRKLMFKMFRSPYWVMLDRGTLAGQAAEDAMTGFDEELRAAVRLVLRRRYELTEVVPEGLELLHACKARGKKSYVLSNYSADAFRHALELHDFFRLFDGMVVSGEEDLVKPDPAIYRVIESRYGLTPARTLFVDDNPSNVEAALSAGWQGFCLNHPGKLHDFLAR